METTRSTHDLIDELDEEATASGTSQTAIVVGFENSSSFVFAFEANKLKKLNGFVRQGGKPIGIISFLQDGDKGRARVRAFAEYDREPWVKHYLTGVTLDCVAALEAAKMVKIDKN
jgi:hypothetical protein